MLIDTMRAAPCGDAGLAIVALRKHNRQSSLFVFPLLEALAVFTPFLPRKRQQQHSVVPTLTWGMSTGTLTGRYNDACSSCLERLTHAARGSTTSCNSHTRIRYGTSYTHVDLLPTIVFCW